MISAYDFSDDLMLILDYTNAKIKINYEYDEYNTNDTTDDTSDDTIEKKNLFLKLIYKEIKLILLIKKIIAKK